MLFQKQFEFPQPGKIPAVTQLSDMWRENCSSVRSELVFQIEKRQENAINTLISFANIA